MGRVYLRRIEKRRTEGKNFLTYIVGPGFCHQITGLQEGIEGSGIGPPTL